MHVREFFHIIGYFQGLIVLRGIFDLGRAYVISYVILVFGQPLRQCLDSLITVQQFSAVRLDT